jgi:gluconokinase
MPTRHIQMIILLMGVAGSGKTTIGEKLAQQLGWSFRDADDFHPRSNIGKMSAGIPLDDADRAPWLAAIRQHIEQCAARGVSAVVACSALKERYRAVLLGGAPSVRLVHLTGSFDLISERMRARRGHFMKPEMLRSQFDALEAPPDAIVVDVAKLPDAVADEIRQRLGLLPEASRR